MRIVIDFQGAQASGRYRGIGRYSTSLVKAIIANNHKHEIYLALNNQFIESVIDIKEEFKSILPESHIHVWASIANLEECSSDESISKWKVAEYLRESFLLALKPDVILICSMFEGCCDDAITSIGRLDSKIPTVPIVYDFIPYYNKVDYLPSGSLYEKFYFRKLDYLKQATSICAISDSSAKEAIEVLDFNKDNIVNIAAGYDEVFKILDISSEEVKNLFDRLNLQKPYLLYTGGIDKRKNIERLIESFSLLDQKLRHMYQLLLVGKKNKDEELWVQHLIEKYDITDSEIIVLNYVDDRDLALLYNLCALFVFPSWHEGFGLPVLEAMACGAPVIASNISSIPEVMGYDEALFNPFSVEEIRSKIEKVLTNQEFRKKLSEHGTRRSKIFTWDRSAEKVIEECEKVASPSQTIFIDNIELKNIVINKLNGINLSPELYSIANMYLNKNLDLEESNYLEPDNTFEKIYKKVFGKKHIWFGQYPVINADIVDFNKGTNSRVSSKMHRQYDSVWIYETQLFEHANWELILDESIRLLGKKGTLVVRHKDSQIASVYALKNKLYRAFFNKVKLKEQINLKDNSTVSVFEIERLLCDEYDDKSWSIGVLSDGKRVDSVVKLFESVIKQSNSEKIEFIVAGPNSELFDEYNVKYVSVEYQDSLARISEKKNKIIEQAKNANLIIVHDRYILDNDFFRGFEKWGYDFEFITVQQFYEDGNCFPAYCGFDRRSNHWIPHKYSSTYKQISDGAFINGGLMIFKTKVAKQLLFNDLLLHREGEDIEISWYYRSHGITPRINSISSATTIGVDISYTADYNKFSENLDVDSINQMKKIKYRNMFFYVWTKFPKRFQNLLKKIKVVMYVKNLFNY